MHSTSYITPIRSFIDSYSKNNDQKPSLIPLAKYPKFGNFLKNLYIEHDTLSNKITVCYRDIDSHSFKDLIPFSFDDTDIVFKYTDKSKFPYSYIAFIIKEEGKSCLYINSNGMIFQSEWYDLLYYSDYDFFIAERDNNSYLLDLNGAIQTELGEDKFISYINEELFISEKKGELCIKNYNNEIVASRICGRFDKLTNKDHYIASIDNNKFAIFNFFGEKKSLEFDRIRNMNKNYIVAQKDDMFYLLTLSGEIVINSTDFMEITHVFWS